MFVVTVDGFPLALSAKKGKERWPVFASVLRVPRHVDRVTITLDALQVRDSLFLGDRRADPSPEDGPLLDLIDKLAQILCSQLQWNDCRQTIESHLGMLSHVYEHVLDYLCVPPDSADGRQMATTLLGHYRLVEWSWPSLRRVVLPFVAGARPFGAGARPLIHDPSVFDSQPVETEPLLETFAGRKTDPVSVRWSLFRQLLLPDDGAEAKKSSTDWIPRDDWRAQEWCYQACAHSVTASNMCPLDSVTCWAACDAVTLRHISDLTKGKHTSVAMYHQTRRCEYELAMRLVHGLPTLIQTNLLTGSKRVICQIARNWSSFLRGRHVVATDVILQLIDVLARDSKASASVEPIKRATTAEMPLLTQLPVTETVKALFLNAATCSLSAWAEKSGYTVEARLEPALHPRTFESFLLARSQQAHARQLCLFGFHGTTATDPLAVVNNGGLDPRYAGINKRLFLGQAAYVATTSLYPHANGYAHQCGDEFSQLIVMFLPGRVHYESRANSEEAASRRTAPTGFDTVACLIDGFPVWALYDRTHSCPLFIVRYRVLRKILAASC